MSFLGFNAEDTRGVLVPVTCVRDWVAGLAVS